MVRIQTGFNRMSENLKEAQRNAVLNVLARNVSSMDGFNPCLVDGSSNVWILDCNNNYCAEFFDGGVIEFRYRHFDPAIEEALESLGDWLCWKHPHLFLCVIDEKQQ